MMDFPEYGARSINKHREWKVYAFKSGHVGCSQVAEEGALTVASLNTEEEALELLTLACPLDRESPYHIAEELTPTYQGEPLTALHNFASRLDRCAQRLESAS